ncbi:ATP synthase F1 subcomplex delta subunit [Loktanella fryxellensis]|uniref:ATP synthase subunit delta n=1 Tax=Loktanella fryxellensis TaxID=245187 RepID=A0A1H8DBH3_9RHOB|nr:F0F1 ATP synthase subunit delta [Loktanella fryxellensis]SEN04620.1 ATP synthase F1 subcomplex delta subunit [Loktanella fryxellensis]
MSEPASITQGIAGRYASAVFDIAKDGNDLRAMERDVDTLDTILTDSADFRDLISSPLYGRDDQAAAVKALSGKMDLSPTMANLLGLLADKRRLFVLPAIVTTLRDMLAADRGEITADVTTATPLSDSQRSSLAATLSAQTGKTVGIKETVDASILGGLIVKVGSRMIDTSIASKLNALQNNMKEVG